MGARPRARRAGFHQQHGGGGVVDARGVARRDAAVFFDEHRLELGHVGQRAAGAKVLVGVERDLALAALEQHRHDLRFEAALGAGALGAVVALDRQRVLHGAADAKLRRHVFGCHAHVDFVEGVVQRAHHHVHQCGVAHARAKARHQAEIRRAAHVLGPGADGDVAIAEQDRLAGADDGLQPRAT